jgi:molybdopterin synthase sulfur carrier subunit
MKVDVKLFAAARDVAGAETVSVEIPDSAHVADLRAALALKFPDMKSLIPNLLVAVGNEYADDQTTLDASKEIACFPPVSGG